jgi:hypothetical protein
LGYFRILMAHPSLNGSRVIVSSATHIAFSRV